MSEPAMFLLLASAVPVLLAGAMFSKARQAALEQQAKPKWKRFTRPQLPAPPGQRHGT